ncbi:PH domain-containing protein [Aureliella helgolandensis]|uniref:Bacterial membrane flanked domain protein n=1 Tax=Aureliella helgolandensis TaxID=2527968 RepID=A0A518GDK3_9BACT|nr:PH domain-containing protein [Aureliella helgolandensis]QDV26620.1 Bacterial membrane flanked domain protein [Aureliella helgolandensis]
MSSDIPSSDIPSSEPPNSVTPPADSESPARDKFQAAAAERIAAARAVPPERSLWKGGYSPKAMYGTWVVSAVVTVLALVLVGLFAGDQANVWMIVGAVVLLVWCYVIALYMYRRLSMHYELTTQRFVHQEGLLVRQTDRIEVIDIADVSYKQGIVQRMLGVGSVTIESTDRSHPQLILRGIDKVPEIASLIDDVRREERRRRSLHIETN